MSKPVLVCLFQGRFGNQVCQWLFAKAWAERNDYELRHEPFIGEEIFQIDNVIRPDDRTTVRLNEIEIFQYLPRPVQMYPIGSEPPKPDILSIEFRGYALTQSCMIYTKRQAQEWLKIRPEHLEKLSQIKLDSPIIGHLRKGDYAGYGYPLVSRSSYWNACTEYGLNPSYLRIVAEEHPSDQGLFPDHLSFLPDFYRMVKAHTLLRGNSTFSWLAGLLGNGLVLSPEIAHLEGGREHDVRFVPGNHARLSAHDFVTELHVSP